MPGTCCPTAAAPASAARAAAPSSRARSTTASRTRPICRRATRQGLRAALPGEAAHRPGRSRCARCTGVRPRIIPCRVEKLDKPAPDVAVIGLRLPMNENFRFLAGQYIDMLLKDGKRRSYSLATQARPERRHRARDPCAPHAGRIVHRARIQQAEGAGSAALRGPTGQLLPARGIRQADRSCWRAAPASRRSARSCETALEKKLEQKRPMTLYWGCRVQQRPVPDGARAVLGAARLQVRAGALATRNGAGARASCTAP